MGRLSSGNKGNKIGEKMICYFSEKGHKNFFYPTNKKAILKDGCIYEELNWLSGVAGNHLMAIKVKNSCVLPLTFTTLDDKNIISTDNDYYIVVWIDKKEKEKKCQQ